MADKWEYTWYAAWDLAFHMLAFQAVDHDFAKAQLMLILRNDYQHPNGQIPAYEWNFGDTNPPVHAYATMQIYRATRRRTVAKGIWTFLTSVFSKLLVNFTWWLNRTVQGTICLRVDSSAWTISGIRQERTDTGGGYLEQADVMKFFEHTMWIAGDGPDGELTGHNVG